MPPGPSAAASDRLLSSTPKVRVRSLEAPSLFDSHGNLWDLGKLREARRTGEKVQPEWRGALEDCRIWVDEEIVERVEEELEQIRASPGSDLPR